MQQLLPFQLVYYWGSEDRLDAADTMTQDSERRDFFRVYQDVLFEYKPISADEANQDSPDQPFKAGISMHLASELNRLTRESEPALNLIKEKNRALSEVLSRINAKVDLVVRHQIFSNTEDKTPTRINLSEDGVAFKAKQSFNKNDFVALQIIFVPSYIPILVFGRVIRSEAVEEGFKVAAKFHKLQDIDRKELARQILKVQTLQRKQEDSKNVTGKSTHEKPI